MPSPDDRPRSTSPHDPYRELFERSADAILIIEGETFVDCNDATVRMLRYASREEVLQTHPSELSPPRQSDGRESFEKANEMIAIAFDRGSHRFEWDHVRADGEVFPVEVRLTAVQEPGRRTLHVVWRDITERRLLEDKLRQALKMEAIGQLTGGIAHDFNNLLVTILGNTDLLAERVGEADADAAEAVREIRDASERAADLVRELLAFGRKQQLLPTTLDLNQLTEDMRRLLERLVGGHVSVALQLTEEPVPIKADHSQVEQVLLNLAANARDAMPEGGRLSIATSRVRLAQPRGRGEQELAPGDYAVLTVSDTGCGMDRETAARAFDPFFTTKGVGLGSGLGLATVHGIVTQSGGAVRLRSTLGEGTTVEVLLPITTETAPKPAPEPSPPDRSAGGTETILLAEDEPAVARLVRRALESRGFRVLPCADGREALAVYQQHPEEVALLVTDVIMPRLGGPALVAELEKIGLTPRVLFLSGYTNEGLTRMHQLAADVDVLEKPFQVDELIRRVRAAIDRR